MISTKTIVACFFGATICIAQPINIRGTVQDKDGVGVPGATVKLEKARIFATTGSGGSFTLTNGPAAIPETNKHRSNWASPFRLQNGRIEFSLFESKLVSAAVFNVVGKQLFSSRKTFDPGSHHLACPGRTGEIYFIRVQIGEAQYSFKLSPWGTFSASAKSIITSSDGSTQTKQAKAFAVLADVISAEKEGQIDYRDSIRISDTTGIIIKMIPNAGNVTDGSGNVYQSVRIGNQRWTVQNLRTTKLKDGTPIPLVTSKAAWDKLTTPAYCFYENSTDTAYQRKWGALYTWYAVKTGKLAPDTWRVPTEADWTALKLYLMANKYNWDGTTTEDKTAKSMGAKTDWYPAPGPESKGTLGNDPGSNNSSGFSALPGGTRGASVGFMEQSEACHFWSATTTGSASASSFNIRYSSEGIGMDYSGLRDGFSVRFVRDN